MNRRDFLQYASLTAMSGMLPGFTQAADLHKTGKILVLVHLDGGNDGFNTLVPYHDPEYYNLRPRIGVKERTLLKLDERFGMHPQLKQLLPLWKKGHMAWVQGVGYPNSPLSHFQSLDIWESASLSNYSKGWLSQVVPQIKRGLHGIVINDGVAGSGVMAGSQMNAVTMKNPSSFIHASKKIEDIQVSRHNSAIAHVTEVQHQLYAVGRQIEEKIGSNPKAVPGQYKGELGRGLQAVAQMILNGVDAPVYKVTQGGFDTHASQTVLQNNSLYQLADGISAFANVMRQRGVWNNILVVTYSEFGRRAKENKGGGTDHGTASAQMIFGGNLKPGIYGKHPNLSQLDANGNVRPTTDFRSLYGTIAQHWWRQANPWKAYPVVPFLG